MAQTDRLRIKGGGQTDFPKERSNRSVINMLIIWGYLGESVNGQSVVYFEPLTMIFLWIKSGVWRYGWVIFEHWLKQMAWSYQFCRSSLPPSIPPSFFSPISEDIDTLLLLCWTGTGGGGERKRAVVVERMCLFLNIKHKQENCIYIKIKNKRLVVSTGGFV